jgi:hypothetical protein
MKFDDSGILIPEGHDLVDNTAEALAKAKEVVLKHCKTPMCNLSVDEIRLVMDASYIVERRIGRAGLIELMRSGG